MLSKHVRDVEGDCVSGEVAREGLRLQIGALGLYFSGVRPLREGTRDQTTLPEICHSFRLLIWFEIRSERLYRGRRTV